MKEQFDEVDNPSHYCEGAIECIDAMIAAKGIEKVKAFCECNVFKYNWRSDKKNGLKDMKKARWYLNKFIELCEKAGSEDTVKMFDNGTLHVR